MIKKSKSHNDGNIIKYNKKESLVQEITKLSNTQNEIKIQKRIENTFISEEEIDKNHPDAYLIALDREYKKEWLTKNGKIIKRFKIAFVESDMNNAMKIKNFINNFNKEIENYGVEIFYIKYLTLYDLILGHNKNRCFHLYFFDDLKGYGNYSITNKISLTKGFKERMEGSKIVLILNEPQTIEAINEEYDNNIDYIISHKDELFKGSPSVRKIILDCLKTFGLLNDNYNIVDIDVDLFYGLKNDANGNNISTNAEERDEEVSEDEYIS